MSAWCFHQNDLDKALANWVTQQMDAGCSLDEVSAAKESIRSFMHSQSMQRNKFTDRSASKPTGGTQHG